MMKAEGFTMFNLSVTLSDDLREFLNQRRKAHGFATDDELIEFYVRSESLRLNRQQVDALVEQGIESGEASPLTSEEWQALQDRVNSRASGMKSAS